MTIVPLPAGGEVSSLSAILLDDDYYAYMKSGRKTIDGVTALGEVHLVPFKAKAFLDLSKRRADGEKANSSDIKKHKKDVFRLVQPPPAHRPYYRSADCRISAIGFY